MNIEDMEKKASEPCFHVPLCSTAPFGSKTTTPVADMDLANSLSPRINIAPDVPVLLDAVYANHDAEYRDARALTHIRKSDH